MSQLATTDLSEPRSAYRLPAWLFSALVHLALLVLGAMLFPGMTERVVEEARQVGIVLAAAGGSPEYFTEEHESESDAQTASAAHASATADQASRGDPRGALLPAAEIPLPDLPGGGATPLGDPAGVLDAPRLRVAGRPNLPGLDDAAILADEAKRRKPAGPSGPKTGMSLFGAAPAVGNSFVFLIDRSQSMGGEGIDGLAAAEKELKKQLALLESEHKFQIVAYNQGLLYMTRPRLEPATVENRTAADKFLHQLVAFSATQHEMGLMAGLRLTPDVIFLLTDGGDPPLDGAAVRRITERNGRRTSIHIIVFGRGREPAEVEGFRALAAANGGAYGYVDLNPRK